MSLYRRPQEEEVEHLLRNAQLRDELEPLYDESIASINVQQVSTPVENDFLESMLAWERAPTLPICQWFVPEFQLPPPDTLCQGELQEVLWDAIHKLFEQRIVLDFTDHLTDRELYCLILRDILPAREKKIDSSHNYLHWDCAHASDNPEIWLRYYATAEEREVWALESGGELPEPEVPPFERDLPRAPL